MKTCGSTGIVPLFLNSALEECAWSASGPGSFTPGETAPVNQWLRGWVGTRSDLDAVEKRRILLRRESKPGHRGRSVLLYRLSYCDSRLLQELRSNGANGILSVTFLGEHVIYHTQTVDILRN
jgi:hypothetical protein